LRLSRVLVAVVAFVVLAGIAVGVVTGAFGSWGRRGLEATGLWSSGGASTLVPGGLGSSTSSPTAHAGSDPATPASPTPVALRPVLAPASPGAKPDAAKVTKLINAVDRKGVKDAFSGTVLDVGSGAVLYRHKNTTGYIPASTMKLLTSTAALSLLGPEHRFTTKVVSPKPGSIILVGGGDPYLSSTPRDGRASISVLAKRTAAALKKQHVRKVSLGYDTSLFSGPSWNPTWPDAYADQVSKVSALWVNEGRVTGFSPGPRVSDPAGAAAKAFAAALKKQGIAVAKTTKAKAPAGAAVVGSVSSLPAERIVELLLMASDNDAAEVMFRQAALAAKQPGSFAGGRRAVHDRLASLGVLDSSVRIVDGSGLSRDTRVPADSMAKVLRVAMEEKHPELRGVVTGLPVAGVEGSLRIRFYEDSAQIGRGLVRGKTGTLRKVHSLAGVVRAADGSLLTYAFLVNNAKNEYEAIVWLDEVSAALVRCGCRS
jgi:D-alanyl-D-alanine carboxypeptidase/D-alanyl-D-alanine-endopeptidase (penicillin-binding protein 4)